MTRFITDVAQPQPIAAAEFIAAQRLYLKGTEGKYAALNSKTAMMSIMAMPPPQTLVGYSKCAEISSSLPTTFAIH
jgi:hypothetical protein